MKRFTAKDVAALAGVDPSTVSRVLRGATSQHHYDPDTIRRIRSAATQLGYVPSRAARALRTGVTHRIGLLVSDISNPFFAELAGRIERHLRGKGYRLLVASTDESSSQQHEHLRDLVDHGVDGLILSPSGVHGISQALESRIPLITVDRQAAGVHVSHVGLDDALAGEMLGERLRKSEYASIGVVMPDTDSDHGAAARLDGLTRSLGKASIKWIEQAPLSVAQSQVARACAKQIKASPVDAIVGLYNTGTLAALDAIRDAHLEIPAQIGVAGIDDFAAAEHLRPAITVVAQPLDQIASQAAELLLSKIAKVSRAPIVQLLKPRLVERQSLRPIRRNI
jgi:LacI family transcriptional regulator